MIDRRRLLLAGVATTAAPVRAQARAFQLGLLTQADDERYAPQQLQKGYPEAPGGRSEGAAHIALNDSAFDLQAAGWSSSATAWTARGPS